MWQLAQEERVKINEYYARSSGSSLSPHLAPVTKFFLFVFFLPAVEGMLLGASKFSFKATLNTVWKVKILKLLI